MIKFLVIIVTSCYALGYLASTLPERVRPDLCPADATEYHDSFCLS